MILPVKNGTSFKNKIYKEFEKYSKETVVHKFLYETSNLTNVFIVGGFLRDIINNQRTRDVDVIINLREQLLFKQLKKYSLPWIKNKFGGYKINVNNTNLDVWTIDNNWAFKNNLVNNYHSEIVNKIAEGTFFNYDSLVFDIRTQYSNFKLYNECVTTATLDIIRKSSRYLYGNPGKLNNVLRAFTIRKKTKLNFSLSLCKYIKTNLSHLGIVDKNELFNYLNNEASKQERFLLIADLNAIEENMTHLEETIKKSRIQGDQLFLF